MNKYKYFKLSLASPEQILSWSSGEVVNSETIDYRSNIPKPGGLYCEKIFGPVKDYQCQCKTRKSKMAVANVCEKCGVELTLHEIRRERMGHIKLMVPVVHYWFLRSGQISTLLGLKQQEVEELTNYGSFYVFDDGGLEELRDKTIISDRERSELEITYGPGTFDAESGALAIKRLLQNINLELEAAKLKFGIKETGSKSEREKMIKRLRLVEDMRKGGIKPEWMVIEYLPVLPADLRPIVPVAGGKTGTVDLADLYREVINCNNRYKYFMSYGGLGFPEQVQKNERRMIQRAVSQLIDNSKMKSQSKAKNQRVRKSLSEALRGKQGRFRQNLLGKRVDYSGRSVIAVGPDLKMYQCGLPWEMALVLFKPFIIHELIKEGERLAKDLNDNTQILSSKKAKEMIDAKHPRALAQLEAIISEHPVLLNRAPTLHRLGIQAFEPKLVEGKAIRLHPLCTTAFNADFDGDQMAVHVPLSIEAQTEARLLMLSSKNILAPKDGKPIVTPSQDMVIGNYYLTFETRDEHNVPRFFHDTDELETAYENGEIELSTRIFLPTRALDNFYWPEEYKNAFILTTYGKTIFNKVLPLAKDNPHAAKMVYINEPVKANLGYVGYETPAGADGELDAVEKEVKKDKFAKFPLHRFILKRGEDPAEFLRGWRYDYEVYDEARERKAQIFANFTRLLKKEELFDSDIREFIQKKGFSNLQLKELFASREKAKAEDNELLARFKTALDNENIGNLSKFDKVIDDLVRAFYQEKAGRKIIPHPYTVKMLSQVIAEVFKRYQIAETSKTLDKMKDTGFKYATQSGLTVSIFDIENLADRDAVIKHSEARVELLERAERRGKMSKAQLEEQTNLVWTEARNTLVQSSVIDAERHYMTNPLYIMSDSGARGSPRNFVQLIGIRGLMSKPNGGVIPIPVKSSFREGLTMSEFFMSSHGARKGSTDTALKTSQSGYLTRRLVDVSQDVVIREEDCGTDRGETVKTIYASDGKVLVALEDRISGRFLARDVEVDRERLHHRGTLLSAALVQSIKLSKIEKLLLVNSAGEEIEAKATALKKYTDKDYTLARALKTTREVYPRNTLIDAGRAKDIIASGINAVEIRTIATCNAKKGVCAKCYGSDLSTSREVEKGEAIGIIAAQSIGEPGTQLTMRTFHTGGVAGGGDITQGLPRVQDLFEARNPKTKAILSDVGGIVVGFSTGEGTTGNKTTVIEIAHFFDGQPIIVEASQKMAREIAADAKVTLPVAKRYKEETLQKFISNFWRDAELTAEEYKTLAAEGKGKRYANYLKYQEAMYSYLTEGFKLGGEAAQIEVCTYEVKKAEPIDKSIALGAVIVPGQSLTIGAKAPKELLNICDLSTVEQYILEEVHNVYQTNSVGVSDKHIEIIIKQMCQKVQIFHAGDADLLVGDQVSRPIIYDAMLESIAENGTPPAFKPILLGITRAALNSDSLLSAASFQETTDVLTGAALAGKRDYLEGLKENVVIGGLIPAGTGLVEISEADIYPNAEIVAKNFAELLAKEPRIAEFYQKAKIASPFIFLENKEETIMLLKAYNAQLPEAEIIAPELLEQKLHDYQLWFRV